MKTTAASLCLGVLVTMAQGAHAAEDYPSKPVEFIVPWPPGGEEDVLTRMIAEQFQKMNGVPAAVVNKPGGGGGPFPGAVEVAMAPADGYTVGSFVLGVPVVGPQLGIPQLDPDPFVPVGIFLTYPFVIATSSDAPYDSMEELAEYARTNDVTLGHFGAALVPTRVTLDLAEEMRFEFASDAAFDNVDCNTLASGDADVVNSVVSLIAPCMEDVKVLATVTEKRLGLLPDVPTVAEIAPSLDIVLWNGLFVREGTPDSAIAKIEAAARAAIESPEAQDYAAGNGAELYWKDRAAAERQIRDDIEAFGQLGD